MLLRLLQTSVTVQAIVSTHAELILIACGSSARLQSKCVFAVCLALASNIIFETSLVTRRRNKRLKRPNASLRTPQLSRGRAASDSLALGWPRRGRRNFLLLLRAPPISLSLSLSLTAPRSACGELSCSFAIAASTLLGAFLSAGAAATRSRRGAAPPRPKERLCALSRLAPPPQRLLLLLSCWRPVTTSSLLDGRALSTIASALFGGGGGGGRGEAATPSSCFFGGALSRRDAVAERRVLLH